MSVASACLSFSFLSLFPFLFLFLFFSLPSLFPLAVNTKAIDLSLDLTTFLLYLFLLSILLFVLYLLS